MASTQKTLRLAVIGGGIFARQHHVPQILALPDLITVVAVWSNSKQSAELTASLFSNKLDVYFENGGEGESADGKRYDDLLTRSDIDAVDLVIPIDNMPEFVEKALKVGKHVLSEKPMAPTVEIGRQMAKKYREEHSKAFPGLVWSVAEQLWYESSWKSIMDHRLQHWPSKISLSEPQTDSKENSSAASGAQLSGSSDSTQSSINSSVGLSHIGTPLVATLTRLSAANVDNKYYSTKWRFVPNYQGGYLFDGGVHEICKLRMMFGEVEEVGAIAHQFKPDLPPSDTMVSFLRFQSGLVCTFTYTFTTVSVPVSQATISHDLMLTGTNGTVAAKNNEIIVRYPDPVTKEVKQLATPIDNEQGNLSVRREIEAFARAALGLKPNGFDYYTPEQALGDVTVIQAILEASKNGKTVKISSFQ